MAKTIDELQEMMEADFRKFTTLETLMHNILYCKTEEDLDRMGESLNRHVNDEKDLSLMNFYDLNMLICAKRRELEYGKFIGRIVSEVHSFCNDGHYLSEE